MDNGATPADPEVEQSPTRGDSDAGDGGVVIRNPVTGVSVAGTDRAGWDVEIRLEPGASGPAEHVHRTIEERFEVCEGTATFRVDGRERALGAGTELRISPGTAHAFGNDADEEAVLLGRTVPENDELGRVVATLFGLASEGRTDDWGRPGFLQGAVIAEAALEETYFADVPYGVQRAVGRLFGPLGRALGYRATYDRYLEESFWRGESDGSGRAGDR
ncbi:cupin domain-containing protein [Salinirubellus sp. GCM10025818]|uniref:cupin domain-containing protein n=1 Tax=Salinirubellus TaxID=2162630 RepID=UPI0030D28635